MESGARAGTQVAAAAVVCAAGVMRVSGYCRRGNDSWGHARPDTRIFRHEEEVRLPLADALAPLLVIGRRVTSHGQLRGRRRWRRGRLQAQRAAATRRQVQLPRAFECCAFSSRAPSALFVSPSQNAELQKQIEIMQDRYVRACGPVCTSLTRFSGINLRTHVWRAECR
jgi:hypothetical protein